MFESGEVVNLIVSPILLVYLIYILKSRNRNVKELWVLAIILIMFSQFCTVAEGFFLENILNFLEHLSFTIGCILLLISTLKKEL
jgi:hypothetical protein